MPRAQVCEDVCPARGERGWAGAGGSWSKRSLTHTYTPHVSHTPCTPHTLISHTHIPETRATHAIHKHHTHYTVIPHHTHTQMIHSLLYTPHTLTPHSPHTLTSDTLTPHTPYTICYTHHTHLHHTHTPYTPCALHTHSHHTHTPSHSPPFPRDAVVGGKPRLPHAHVEEVAHDREHWGWSQKRILLTGQSLFSL